MGPWEMIVSERARQLCKEGYSPAHDDQHTEGQLAVLAAAYALSSRSGYETRLQRMVAAHLLDTYGWKFKPKDPVRDLVRAGALILAELERVIRRGGH
jgi:hypothetical protein